MEYTKISINSYSQISTVVAPRSLPPGMDALITGTVEEGLFCNMHLSKRSTLCTYVLSFCNVDGPCGGHDECAMYLNPGNRCVEIGDSNYECLCDQDGYAPNYDQKKCVFRRQ